MNIKIERGTLVVLGIFVAVPMLFILLLAFAKGPADSGSNPTGDAQADSEVSISVSGGDISPSKIQIPAGENVLLKVKNDGASGCTSSLISRSLFKGPLSLGQEGDEVEQIIRAEEPGNYTITCWMGMVGMDVEAI
ncbi:MAG: cupredoxin domain-containing protein [Candidatus Dojkabacteria bacterium]|nr:MAG: cupredoxin domain-containing protein [Candidatus Dojkabacteria bacterium]